jgi:hypothetical protein
MSMETRQQTKPGPKQKKSANGQKQDMLDLAAKIETHYTSPSPQASNYTPNYFPRVLDAGIVLGLVLGALAGLLLAWLLLSGRLAPEGWEGLFSLSPYTFYTFWAITGAALGLAVGGLATLLTAHVPDVASPGDKGQS